MKRNQPLSMINWVSNLCIGHIYFVFVCIEKYIRSSWVIESFCHFWRYTKRGKKKLEKYPILNRFQSHKNRHAQRWVESMQINKSSNTLLFAKEINYFFHIPYFVSSACISCKPTLFMCMRRVFVVDLKMITHRKREAHGCNQKTQTMLFS